VEESDSAPLQPATSYTRLDAEGKPYLQASRCEVCQAVFLGEREHCGRCGARSQMKPTVLAQRGQLYNTRLFIAATPASKSHSSRPSWILKAVGP